jgi:ribonuclease T2
MKKHVVLFFFMGIFILTSSCSTTKSIATNTLPPTATNPLSPTDTHAPTATNSPTASPHPPTKTPFPPTATASLVDIVKDQLSWDFDYFILALAWEPDYCATSDNPDPQACAPGLKLGFILHGLWPMYNEGWPSYCSTETMSNELIAEFPGLFPTDFLYGHEWEKHGTCTGLDPEGYFLLSGEFKRSITIPDAFISPDEPFRMDANGLIDSFVKVNPSYDKKTFSVFCSGAGQYLSELYVCISKDGQPTECGSDVVETNAESCGQPDFLVRNPR